MSLSIKGKLSRKLSIESGTSKAGKEWKKQTFLVDTGAQYNPEICFQLFGEEKIEMLNHHNEGDQVEVSFNLSSKEIDQPSDFETYISKEIIELNKKLKTNEKLEFTKQEQHYVQKGIYSIQLKPWFEIFPRENILILSTEDLEKNNASVYSEIFNFLDIPDCEIDAKRRIGKGEYLPMKNTTRQILSDFYKEHNEELFKLIGKRFEWIS